jgi:MFS family permease
MIGKPTDERAGISSNWVLVWMLAVIGMLNTADRTSVTAVFPLLKSGLGFTDVSLGAIGSFFLWSYALASPFAGYLGDRFNRSRIVLWSLLVWSLVMALSGLVNARWELLFMRVLLGIVESLFLPAALALIAEYQPAKTVGTSMGVLGLGQCLGAIGGTTFGGFLADHYGWRPSFLALGIAGILIALPAYFLLPRKKPAALAGKSEVPETRPRPQLSFMDASIRLLKVPSFLVISAAGGLTAIGVWIFTNWLPLYFKEAFDMSLTSAGFFGATFINGSAAVSMMLGGMASDRAARKGPQYRMLLQGFLTLAAAPTLLVFIWTRSLPAIVVALTLNSALINAAAVNMQPLLCDLAGEDKFSIAFGITNMMNCLAGGLGIFVAGLLKASLGLKGDFVGIVGILIIEALMLFCGYWMFLKKDIQNSSVAVAREVAPAPSL